jgi:hypothetical protein
MIGTTADTGSEQPRKDQHSLSQSLIFTGHFGRESTMRD